MSVINFLCGGSMTDIFGLYNDIYSNVNGMLFDINC